MQVDDKQCVTNRIESGQTKQQRGCDISHLVGVASSRNNKAEMVRTPYKELYGSYMGSLSRQSSIFAYRGLREGMPKDIEIIHKLQRRLHASPLPPATKAIRTPLQAMPLSPNLKRDCVVAETPKGDALVFSSVQTRKSVYPWQRIIWGVVNIMVPFWIPYIPRTQKGTII